MGLATPPVEKISYIKKTSTNMDSTTIWNNSTQPSKPGEGPPTEGQITLVG
uniref:Uncharacterized protein n=1 Tax=Arion vulgaris TaxID=1028688 RepID=A0A0B7AS60_9EUPU